MAELSQLSAKTTAEANQDLLDRLVNAHFTAAFPMDAVVDANVTSAAATNLTSSSVTPPSKSWTIEEVLLVATIHAVNGSANAHNIGLKVQGQKDSGGYSDLGNDLTANYVLGLSASAQAADGVTVTLDASSLVDALGSTYDFRFVVDSDNANRVDYLTSFLLLIRYSV